MLRIIFILVLYSGSINRNNFYWPEPEQKLFLTEALLIEMIFTDSSHNRKLFLSKDMLIKIIFAGPKPQINLFWTKAVLIRIIFTDPNQNKNYS